MPLPPCLLTPRVDPLGYATTTPHRIVGVHAAPAAHGRHYPQRPDPSRAGTQASSSAACTRGISPCRRDASACSRLPGCRAVACSRLPACSRCVPSSRTRPPPGPRAVVVGAAPAGVSQPWSPRRRPPRRRSQPRSLRCGPLGRCTTVPLTDAAGTVPHRARHCSSRSGKGGGGSTLGTTDPTAGGPPGHRRKAAAARHLAPKLGPLLPAPAAYAPCAGPPPPHGRACHAGTPRPPHAVSRSDKRERPPQMPRRRRPGGRANFR